jgi:outer membrane scaffolding protein for murein synthesis (MipA/OmpV family)
MSVAATLAFIATPAPAQLQPLWEVGAGASLFSFPDYRGSDETHQYLLPVPYVVYRGEHLKADRNGVRGVVFDSERVEVNASVSASLPVDSRNNAARAGMPDLHPTLELGPSLDVTLWRSSDRRNRVDVRLPVRLGISVESPYRPLGWQASPRINVDIGGVAGWTGWNFGVLMGPLYGSQKYHDYFYSVAPQYATVMRPSYDARGGYAGTQWLLAVSKRFPRYWVGGFLRRDRLDGAEFSASPLVKNRDYIAAGVAVAWIINTSAQMVTESE